MEETKIIYHIDDEETPYLIKLPIPADRVTLGDFKNALNRPNYKFFFKSMDDDFGVVKEEIVDDEVNLPRINGRVVSWLVAAESSASDTQSQCTDSQAGDLPMPPAERVGGIGDSRPPSFHANASTRDLDNDTCDTCTETESLMSNRRIPSRPHPPQSRHRQHPQMPRMNGHSKSGRERTHGFDATSSVMSSDIETTSFFDSEDDASSRFSTATETTARSSKYGRHRRRRRRHRMPPISRASSFSSITDSTMSLNIITVTLNMDTVNFLGISIVGQSNKGGDGGIYVGSIMKGGAVAQDGRIEPGDMILEVNGISFENMSNDDAVRTLREAVQKPGPITLVVAKCWDPNPKGYFTIPRQEPVRPIDPSAWVAHTNAVRGDFFNNRGPGAMSPSLSTVTSTTSSLSSSMPDSERFHDNLNLTVNTDMVTIVKAMAQPDSGLEIRDRMWLKITIPNAFIGSDLVDWLNTHIEGFADRRDARKYACNLLKAGYIRHTVNKLTFSEQCYYVFGDLCGVPGMAEFDTSMFSSAPLMPNMVTNMSSLTLEDIDSVSEVERDTLGPLPIPAWSTTQYNPYGPTYVPPPPQGYVPPKPYGYTNDTASYVSMPGGGGNGSAGSAHSGSGESQTPKREKSCACLVSHTYKQIRKLWEIKDKETLQANGGFTHMGAPPFDDIDRSTSSSTVASSMQALTDLTVAHEVCLELCLPFWKCPAVGQKPSSHRPIAKLAPPTEMNNNRSKDATATHKDFSLIKSTNTTTNCDNSNSKPPLQDSSEGKGPVSKNSKTKAVTPVMETTFDSTNSAQEKASEQLTKEGESGDGEGHYERIHEVPAVSPAVCAMSFYSEASSGSSASGGSQSRKDKNGHDRKSPGGSGSETETGSVISNQRVKPPTAPMMPVNPAERQLPPPPRQLDQANPDLCGSKQSFRMAMGNPYADETLTDMGDL